ncbi:hypothetical protein [Bradyrhizobium diazoefficiens]|uniref:hypothetical protein n=1 Tax=Bradyrhizobium diazoefficiens TaxID=1355477 RepID=UPI003D9BFAAB
MSGQQVSWPGELPVLRATEWALRSERASPPAQAVPQKVAWLQQAEVAEESDAPVLPRAVAESVSVRAAVGLLPEAAVSGHVAAEPRPEAVSAPWVQPAAAGVAEEPDGSRAAQPAVAAASGGPVRQPAEARRGDVAVQPPAAVRPVPWARQVAAQQVAAEAALPGAQRAAVPLALPSEAASVFRQGPILAGPGRPRAAARFAHAMRSLQIASRSERSWQAARNEGWSCGSTSPEGSLTKRWFEVLVQRSVGMNGYALGRIVAGEVVAARFISARKSRHYGDVHCAFRRWLQSPHM